MLEVRGPKYQIIKFLFNLEKRLITYITLSEMLYKHNRRLISYITLSEMLYNRDRKCVPETHFLKY